MTVGMAALAEPVAAVASRRWSPALDAQVRTAYEAGGLPAAEAALAPSGFTRSAVKNRVHQLGLRHPQRHWTPAEDDAIRTQYAAGRSAPEISPLLNRGVPAIRRRAQKLGVISGRNWTEAEEEAVRARYATDGARALARELLGSDGQVYLQMVYRLAERLGVTVPVRHPDWVYDRVRELHARGLNDRKIAAAIREYFPGRNDRERVTAIRRRMGLPSIKPSADEMRELGRRTRAAQEAAGQNPRDVAFARFAARYNLPPDTPPRAVEICLALVGGPKSLDELEAAGCKPRLTWNAIPTTYIAGLVRRGLAASTPLPGCSNRGPRVLYFLTPEAMALLAEGGARADAE